jgi:hypothetical protein
MPKTYELLSTTTLGSAQGTINITSISTAYTDLRVTLFVPTFSNTGQDPHLRVNSNSNSIYYLRTINQNNASAPNNVNYSASNRIFIGNQTVYTNSSYPTFFTFDFLDYADTVVYKTVIITASQSKTNSSGDLARSFGMIDTTSAINELTFTGVHDFSSGTQVKIYGILKA